jgi:hypothetical protein
MKCEIIKKLHLVDYNKKIPDDAYCKNEAVAKMIFLNNQVELSLLVFDDDYDTSIVCQDCLNRRKFKNQFVKIIYLDWL